MSDIHTTFHLGRRGDVPGGMTQVVNDYLTWDFPRFNQAVIPTRATGRWATLWCFVRAIAKVNALDFDQKPVIVAHLSQGGSFLREGTVAAFAFRRGLPVVAQVHGSSFPRFSRRHRRIVRWVLKRTHAIHVLSAESADAIAGLGVAVPVLVIPNAVGAAPAAVKRNLVVFGGAVTRRKGVDVLLSAWDSLKISDGWELVVAGPHTERELVSNLGAGVSAPGTLAREDLRRLLAEARIAVLPSLDEAMPLFILEALASDAAVIATPVGGIPSVIQSSTGMLVAPGDELALSSALTTLMRDGHRRELLARAGRAEWQSTYSPEVVVPQLENLWLLAIDRAVSET